MRVIVVCLLFVVLQGEAAIYDNVTYTPEERQLLDFKLEHPDPIGLWTKSSGEPTEIREIFTINTDQFNNQLLIESMTNFDAERIPERVVHAKGTGAFGYFVVTNDVSKYTYADLFNGIGKKTPLNVRFSTAVQNLGGPDLARELKGMAVKFYTKEGNLDLLCLQTPVYLYRDPLLFPHLVHAFKRNPQTGLFSFTSRWDMIIQRPVLLHTFFWVLSDYGLPDGYRKMDAFPIHTYELANKHGETHYVRFNFRTEQGFSAITSAQAALIPDPDYFNRDLYNAIGLGNYPAWRLEMDVMTPHDIKTVDYDPFDVTRLWKNGTFTTVQIGRVVLNKNAENQFRDMELGAYNPSNLVPGIPGPVDFLFRGRRSFYRDTQNYRIGTNHNKVLVNKPLYAKTYNRDGKPPVLRNMRNAPNYYPNSYNGPVPYVDERKPWEKLQVLESNAVDLQPVSYFYNHILESEDHRQRFILNLVVSLVPVTPPTLQKVIKLLYLVDRDLGTRVSAALEVAYAQRAAGQAAALVTPAPSVPLRNIPNAEEKCKTPDIKAEGAKGAEGAE
ncbi:uncharacterized protein LOC113505349 [Trichoplusia ni]|uniref:Uncharacterized protein LOC113505349 n=1 Tax=Trichoplusia ni TaxID=7111 RepID=A0A7E5WU45_TRINI|nr:uncharacterized protein LOC113505349 [Trichoplusia ni]